MAFWGYPIFDPLVVVLPWVFQVRRKVDEVVPPVNIPILTEILPKMGGKFTYLNVGSQNGFDNHRQIKSPVNFLVSAGWLVLLRVAVLDWAWILGLTGV